MTDADDAGLVYGLRNVWTSNAICAAAADRIEAQQREIEELRRERDIANEAWKGTRCAELREQERAEKAEAALAEALKLLRRIDGIAIKKKSGAIVEVQSIVRAFLPYPWKTFND